MDAVVVLTRWTEEEMLQTGGSGDWVANKESVAACRYLVATWNGDESIRPHGQAFLIGRGLSVIPRNDEKRVLIGFTEFAPLNLPSAWPVARRNPVAYMNLAELNVNPESLQWQAVPEQTAEAIEELTSLELGFKLVSVENVFEPDPVMTALCVLDKNNGAVRPVAPVDFINRIAAINLSPKTPLEVRKAFLLTRNAMCYGYWYYPMFTLGFEQLLRVADFAITEAALQYGIADPKNMKKPVSFAERIDALARIDAIQQERKDQWNVIRNFRNHVSRIRSQSIYAPSDALMMLSRVQTAIDGIVWKPNAAHGKDAVA